MITTLSSIRCRPTHSASFPAIVLGASLAVMPLASPASAQAPGDQEVFDSGWLAWSGCWSSVVQGGQTDPAAGASRDAGTVGAGAILCVRPIEDGRAAELRTSADPAGAQGAGDPGAALLPGDDQAVRVLRLDGVDRPYDVEGCDGSLRSTLSEDGRRIYLRSEHECAGLRRVSTGILALVSPHEWTDVRTVEVEGDVSTWTRRYRIADPAAVEQAGLEAWIPDETMALQSARVHAAAAPDADAVMDAVRHVHAGALVAWVAEMNDPFDLTGDELVRMAEAGVPGEVTDVMVAVSFPDRFDVERNGGVGISETRAMAAPSAARGPRGMGRPYYGSSFRWSRWGGSFFYNPFFYDPFYDAFYGSRGYYSPYRSGYYGYGYSPTIVYVTPRSAEPQGGRVISGQGYSSAGQTGRVARPRSTNGGSSAAPAPRSTREPSATSRSTGGSSSPSASSSRGSGSSRGGSVSSGGGYSSGSSSGTTRRARPRTDGDGGG